MMGKRALIVLFSGLLWTGCNKKDNPPIVAPSSTAPLTSSDIPKLLGTWTGNYPLPPHTINESIVLYITYQSNDTVEGYGVIGDSADHANEHLPFNTFMHVGIIQNDSLYDYLYPAESSNPLFYTAQIADSSLQGYLWLVDVRGDMAGIQSVTMTR